MRDAVTRSIILCYKENVEDLLSVLEKEGLDPVVYRGEYSQEEKKLPSASRTLLNHRRAWEAASRNDGYTFICEADFVPCVGLGGLDVFWPVERRLAWGYLYQGSPRLLSVIGSDHHLRCHCAPLVGYVINKHVAEILLKFYDVEVERYGLEQYFTFDAHLQWWAMGEGAEAFMPARHYGEHGGLPNPEHAKSVNVTRAGRHRADNLVAPLAFLPLYAEGSRMKLLMERLKYRAFGWARLVTGRWIADTNVYPRDWRQTARMTMVGIRRLL